MLKPESLARLPDALVKLWQAVSDDILCDVARRIGKMDTVTEAAQWQLWRYEQARLLKKDITRTLARYSGKSDAEIRRMLVQAGTETLTRDDALYTATGIDLLAVNDSPALLNLLNAGYAQTSGEWRNLTATTASTVTGQFEAACDRAWLQVSSGAFDYNTSIRRAVSGLAADMPEITYPTGHTDKLEVAVRRCALTGVNQTAAKLQMERANEAGWEFFEVTAHEGARPSHAVWQGKVYHKGGRVTVDGVVYEDFVKSTGYGTGAGLCGWNCRHSFSPFWPGVSERAWTDEELAALDEKNIEYNSKQYSQYEISQMQRGLERRVRTAKRQYLAQTAAGQDAGTEAVKLKQTRQNLKAFTSAVHQSTSDSVRTFVPGFGRSEAAKAVAQAGKSALTRPLKNSTIQARGSDMSLEYQRYGRDKSTLVNSTYINSGEYRNKFDKITDNKAVSRTLYAKAKEMLEHRSGTRIEDMYWIDGQTGEVVASVTDQPETVVERVIYPESVKKAIRDRKNLIAMHTHPSSLPPSAADFNAARYHNYEVSLVICHNGKIFQYVTAQYLDVDLYDAYIKRYIKDGFSEYDAQLKALESLEKSFDIDFWEVLP